MKEAAMSFFVQHVHCLTQGSSVNKSVSLIVCFTRLVHKSARPLIEEAAQCSTVFYIRLCVFYSKLTWYIRLPYVCRYLLPCRRR